MSIRPRYWSDVDADEQARILTRSEAGIAERIPAVEVIISRVREHGDRAIHELNAELDGVDTSGLPLIAGRQEIAEAAAACQSSLAEALKTAIENVERFHRQQVHDPPPIVAVERGIRAQERVFPLSSAGLYVPRGRGSFPSMLYMLGVPARLAGVPRLVVASPPGPGGALDPAIAWVCRELGISEILRTGGAQAIAALALGTESCKPVVKVTGPGSAWVAAARRVLAGTIDTGLPAGPTESVVIADRAADPWIVALDALIEAEHGEDSCTLVLCETRAIAEGCSEFLDSFVEELPEPRRSFARTVLETNGGIFICRDLQECAEVANRFAPEHLQLQVEQPWELAAQIPDAAEILIGPATPFSLANYIAGPNAVLPTGGRARSASPVSVRDFQRSSTVIEAEEEALRRLAPHIVTLADYEGFPAHALAIRRRGLVSE